MTSLTASVEGPKVKGRHKLLAVVVVLLGLVVVGVVLFSHRGLYRVYRFHHERVGLDQENARLAEENARLARTIDRLGHDPEMIQDLIRRELNFVKKNEIIFQLPPGSQNKPSASPAPPRAAQDQPLAKAESPPAAGAKSWSWNLLEGAPRPDPKNSP